MELLLTFGARSRRHERGAPDGAAHDAGRYDDADGDRRLERQLDAEKLLKDGEFIQFRREDVTHAEQVVDGRHRRNDVDKGDVDVDVCSMYLTKPSSIIYIYI